MLTVAYMASALLLLRSQPSTVATGVDARKLIPAACIINEYPRYKGTPCISIGPHAAEVNIRTVKLKLGKYIESPGSWATGDS